MPRLLKIIFFLSAFIYQQCFFSFAQPDKSLEGKLTFVYISDLNLYPTPLSGVNEKSFYEKKDGLLIYESQAIFQEIIRYINQKLNFDFVVFGGNNISELIASNFNKENNIHLFLDMIPEIKTKILFVVGKNETKSHSKNDLLKTINSLGINTKTTWWSYKFNNYLLIGLNTGNNFSEFTSDSQLKWLNEILKENKDRTTILFLHSSIIKPDGNFTEIPPVVKILNIIKSNTQIKLVLSGNEYLNRIKSLNNTVYVVNPSLIAYPCAFSYVELTPSMVSIKRITLPLGGVIKKAEESLIQSDRAKSLFINNPKEIKTYVLGGKSDINFEFNF